MNDPVTHAETNLIKKIRFLNTRHKVKWEKIRVIVVRMKVDENDQIYFTMSKPCIHCTNALQRTKISFVSWSNNFGEFDSCKVCDLQSEHLSRRYRGYET